MWWVVLLAMSSTPAHAQDDEARAKELFRDGRDLYDRGKYEDAIRAWSEAYDLSAKPLLLYNLSNAYERTAQLDKALDALTRYRADAPPTEAATLDARIAALELRAEESRRERELADAERKAREEELEAQRKRTEELERQRAEAAVAAESRGGGAPILPIVTTAGGGVLLGVGAITGVGVAKARSRLKDPAICGESGICKADAEDDLALQRRMGLVTDLLLTGGVAAAAVGGVLFVRHAKKSRSPSVWAAPGADGATVGVSGAF
ncbi:MAG: hypothetical protein H6737_22075 [Alphaproteobacteria bacterium]|nr:hypothetical protein [Alphaproteobacteria bacterium]